MFPVLLPKPLFRYTDQELELAIKIREQKLEAMKTEALRNAELAVAILHNELKKRHEPRRFK